MTNLMITNEIKEEKEVNRVFWITDFMIKREIKKEKAVKIVFKWPILWL